MSEDIVAAALRAATYADAIMCQTVTGADAQSRIVEASRKTAIGGDIDLPPDEPHDDWRPIPGFSSSIEKWCPATGETHAHYQVFIDRSSRTPSALWRSNHNGVYQGVRTVTPPGGEYTGYTGPMYSQTHSPGYLGHHETVEEAKAAAERHFAETYGSPKSVGDYDLDSIMDEHGAPPPPRRGLGDDEDYSRIFDAVRRALKRAGAALRRATTKMAAMNELDWDTFTRAVGDDPDEQPTAITDAGDTYYVMPPWKHHEQPVNGFGEVVESEHPEMWALIHRYDPDNGYWDHAVTYHPTMEHAKGAAEHHHVTGEAPSRWPGTIPHSDYDPDRVEAWPDIAENMEHEREGYDEDDEDDDRDPLPSMPDVTLKDRKDAGLRWQKYLDGRELFYGGDDSGSSQRHYDVFQERGDNPNNAHHRGKFRVLWSKPGYSGSTGRNAAPDGSFEEEHGGLSYHPSLEDAMTWAEQHNKKNSWNPDEDQDPFDPRIIGAGLHARLAAKVFPVNPGVVGRIAAELFPPCPGCNQVAGFDPHPTLPSMVTCRNCKRPMFDEAMNYLIGQMLGDHDRAVRALPETDHPTLGKHGQLSYEDAMAHIDRVLAEGEPGGGFADDDDWRCPHCGNTADTGGFFPTLPDGTQVEPTLDSGWDGHYGCGDCGRVVTQVGGDSQ